MTRGLAGSFFFFIFDGFSTSADGEVKYFSGTVLEDSMLGCGAWRGLFRCLIKVSGFCVIFLGARVFWVMLRIRVGSMRVLSAPDHSGIFLLNS